MSKKILIIEDDEVMRKLLAEYLEQEKYLVKIAADGESGIQSALSEKPDLILLDIVLPKKNGYEVLKDLRSDKEMKNVPIILLTNLDSISDVEKALELGATTYLVKADYKLEEISAKVKEFLSKK